MNAKSGMLARGTYGSVVKKDLESDREVRKFEAGFLLLCDFGKVTKLL